VEDSALSSPSLPEAQETVQEKSENELPVEDKWVPGPNLNEPGWLRCKSSILGHALRLHLVQISVMVFALALLIDLVLRWDELRPPLHLQYSLQTIREVLQNIATVLISSPMFFQNGIAQSTESPSTWIGWWINVQSLLGGGTLLVALFVWYGEIREEWENRLPKRMSVFFLYQGLPAIICRYVWLADEGDLRAWAQQVAGQAAQVPYLRFYPNVKAEIPSKAVWIDKKICRHYVVCFELTDNNPDLKKYLGKCCYQNMATGKNEVFVVPLEELQREVPTSVFPFKWPEGQIELPH
jgi:hypothetical protein